MDNYVVFALGVVFGVIITLFWNWWGNLSIQAEAILFENRKKSLEHLKPKETNNSENKEEQDGTKDIVVE